MKQAVMTSPGQIEFREVPAQALGAGVRGLKPGDIATIRPQVTCGTCYACAHGAYHICDTVCHSREVSFIRDRTDAGGVRCWHWDNPLSPCVMDLS